MAEENTVTEQPQSPLPQGYDVDRASQSLEALFDDNLNLREQPEEQEKPQGNRDDRGRFAAQQTEQPTEEADTVEEDAAPEDWSEEHKAAYASLAPEHRAILSAADKARRSAIEAERAQYAEKLKAAEEYAPRLKQLEETYSALGQIKAEKVELVATLKREFGDIKSDADRLALTDVNSAKYDVTRAQRLESLLTMAREMTAAEAAAEHNRKAALDAEQQKDRQAQEAKVYELIPEWGKLAKAGDMTKVRAELQAVREHLKSVGIPEEDANAIYNAHHIQIARESMLYRKAQAEEAQRKKAGAEKLQAAPRVQKPGAGRQLTAAQEARAADLQRAARSGRVEDAAKALEHLL